MKYIKHAFWIVVVSLLLTTPVLAPAQERNERREGGYLVVEGTVTWITARTLIIDGRQYPISMFARVFNRGLKGREMSLATVANVGKIDKARLYILRGKVEKIVVLNNI